MLESFDGKIPRVAESAFVHPTAHIRGDVEIGEYSIVWPGTTISGDMGSIKIGRCVIIEDNCVLHAGACEDWEKNQRSILEIGANVTIGHGAVVHARKIGTRVMIGMNSTVLERVVIGNKCVVAAGALVPEGMKIPDGSMVAGIPANIKGNLKEDHAVWVRDEMEGDDSYYIEYIRKLKDATNIE
ncbi:gamma carbonic anhydrase family protein [Chloroflexota bacterium]